MAPRKHGRRRGQRLSLILAITTGLAVFTVFSVLAGYRGAPRDGSDLEAVAATATQSLSVNPNQGQASASFTATYHVDECDDFATFYRGGEFFLGTANFNT